MGGLLRYELDYFEALLRFFCFRAAAFALLLEIFAAVRRLFVDAEVLCETRLRAAERVRDLRGDGLTRAATAPRVEPIERATLERKSSFFETNF